MDKIILQKRFNPIHINASIGSGIIRINQNGIDFEYIETEALPALISALQEIQKEVENEKA